MIGESSLLGLNTVAICPLTSYDCSTRSSPPAASQPITITARAQSYLDTVSLKGFFTSSCQTRCPPDPYLMPGMLFSASDGDISKTRWIPFPSTSMPDEGPSLRAKDIPRYQHVTVRELDRAGPDYTAQLASGIGGQGYKDWEWASDRTVLCISEPWAWNFPTTYWSITDDLPR